MSQQVEELNSALDGETVEEVAADPFQPDRLYAATLTEIHVSENGGRPFCELTAFRGLPDYSRWTFPPAAHVAHARCIALDTRVSDQIIVGVEEGGVARSRDRGATREDISGPASDTAISKMNDSAGIVPYEMGRHEDGRVYRDVHWVTAIQPGWRRSLRARVLALTTWTMAAKLGANASTARAAPTRFLC